MWAGVGLRIRVIEFCRVRASGCLGSGYSVEGSGTLRLWVFAVRSLRRGSALRVSALTLGQSRRGMLFGVGFGGVAAAARVRVQCEGLETGMCNRKGCKPKTLKPFLHPRLCAVLP